MFLSHLITGSKHNLAIIGNILIYTKIPLRPLRVGRVLPSAITLH